ncbi:hypothetical protein LX12_003537 [Williamsia serinedens]|uniref:Uncharacterized protein n=1 Tax=Williamsia serinedens TaxID=391736 RepID=A0ABT1H6W0_9NOCA|nr:hypothetical protein [Williamsia serinedens]
MTRFIGSRTAFASAKQGSAAIHLACAGSDQDVCPNAVKPGRRRWLWTTVVESPPSRRISPTRPAAVDGGPRLLHSSSAAELSDWVNAASILVDIAESPSRATANARGTLIVDHATSVPVAGSNVEVVSAPTAATVTATRPGAPSAHCANAEANDELGTPGPRAGTDDDVAPDTTVVDGGVTVTVVTVTGAGVESLVAHPPRATAARRRTVEARRRINRCRRSRCSRRHRSRLHSLRRSSCRRRSRSPGSPPSPLCCCRAGR